MPLTRDRDTNTQNTKTQGRRHAAKQRSMRGSWFELFIFFLTAAGVYLVAAFLGGAWTGASGRHIGTWLRSVWGGALLVPLLFWLYLCLAWFVRFRVPRPLGQVLGTLQLYLSIAFMLGLFRKVGWDSNWLLAEPGRVGEGLAHFFVLNLGVLGTVVVSFASLLLSGFFFDSRFFSLLVRPFVLRRSGDVPPATAAAPNAIPSPRLKDEDKPRPRRRPEEGGARLVRHASPGGQPFDPLKPVGTLIAFDREESETGPSAPDAEREMPISGSDAATMMQDEEPRDEETTAPLPEAEPVEPEVLTDGPREPVELPADDEAAGDEEAGEGTSDSLPEGDDETDVGERGEADETTEEEVEESAAESSQTAVEILDHLLASLEAGEFDVPVPPRKDAVIERPSTLRRPPVAEMMESPAREDPEAFAEEPPEKEDEPEAPLRGEGAEGPHGVIEVKSTPKVGPEERVREIKERLASADAPPAEKAGNSGQDTAVSEPFPDVALPEEAGEKRFRAGVFPPPLDIFGPPAPDLDCDNTLELAGKQAEIIVDTLQNFGVKATVAHIVVGPSVIQFQLELAPGIKVSKVAGLSNDLTMALAVVSVRVEAPILGQRYVGIEIPNPKRKGIALRSAMESEEFQKGEFLLPLPMGMRVDSRYLVCGLEDMPHLLVAGTTGSGKSVFVNSCILGMCLRRPPDELRLILVDPKHVEFAIYEGLPHLLARPVSDSRKAIAALSWAVQEMERRAECFARARVRNLSSYNEKVLPKDRFPNIVVVVDELADLMYTAGKEVEGLIARLAQKARAAGIHLILATQRPSVDVITGLIKANVPARVAFAVPSQTDSRTIIDTGGADKLLGKGDMLFFSTRYPRPLRLQAPFITEERTLDFVEYMKEAFGEPEYIEFEDPGNPAGEGNGKNGANIVDDPKMEEAIRVVMDTGIASASGLQRYLNIGYPRAGRLVTGLEQLGIVGPQPANSSKPRDILMDEESAFEALERARTGGLFDED